MTEIVLTVLLSCYSNEETVTKYKLDVLDYYSHFNCHDETGCILIQNKGVSLVSLWKGYMDSNK